MWRGWEGEKEVERESGQCVWRVWEGEKEREVKRKREWTECVWRGREGKREEERVDRVCVERMGGREKTGTLSR